MNEDNRKPTLDRPVTYQIKVPGQLDESWADWNDQMVLVVECDGDGEWVSTLTGLIDQAALQGMLRRLYALGIPLIDVKLVATA